MLNRKALDELSKAEIENIEPSTLVDIGSVAINPELTHEEKIQSYMEQIGNPYCFKSGDIPVCIRFRDSGESLADILVRYFSRLKQN